MAYVTSNRAVQHKIAEDRRDNARLGNLGNLRDVDTSRQSLEGVITDNYYSTIYNAFIDDYRTQWLDGSDAMNPLIYSETVTSEDRRNYPIQNNPDPTYIQNSKFYGNRIANKTDVFISRLHPESRMAQVYDIDDDYDPTGGPWYYPTASLSNKYDQQVVLEAFQTCLPTMVAEVVAEYRNGYTVSDIADMIPKTITKLVGCICKDPVVKLYRLTDC